MTPEQISAVSDSFTRTLSECPEFGARFYCQLISDHPESARFFGGIDMERQHNRFAGQLEIILVRMKDGEEVTSLLQALGKMHQAFGIREDDFKNFGVCLLKVLQELQGTEFDDRLREAWNKVYEAIADSMISAYKRV